MDEYDRILNEFNTDPIANFVISNNYGKDIEDIYELIEEEYYRNISEYIFPGEKVLLYPSIKETRSKKRYYTTFNEASIGINSLYINYHALMINIDRNTKYVLKRALKFELGEDIPYNINELERMAIEKDKEINIRRVR